MSLLERIISLVAPHKCLVCGAEGDLICIMCDNDAFLPLPERCYNCFAYSSAARVCPKCRPGSRIYQLWAYTNYGDVAKQLIKKLKFERAGAAAKTIARHLDQALPVLPPDMIVTHLPTSNQRVRQRGYDQSKLIAKEFAKARGLIFAPLLLRLGDSRQVGANKKTRIHQLAKAFLVKNDSLLKKANILLIDDVITTGASLESAAKTLKKAGAKRIYAAAFAHAPKS